MLAPLSSCLVVDFTTLLPGPLATLMLAQAGAEVVKVERLEGEDMRRFGPFENGCSLPFAMLNRGKRAVALDLKDPAARQRLMPLVQRADVLVEQFRPGVMARLGLDYQSLAEINPRLIYCSISGYGQSGPLAQTVGHDLNYISETGLLSLSHGPLSAPVLPPALIADIAGGSFPAVINILLAVLARQTSGQGCHLDIAMTEAITSFMVFALAERHATGRVPRSGEGLVTGGVARYNLYPTKDGRLLAIAALEERFWQIVCDVTGLEPQFHDDFARPIEARERLAALIFSCRSEDWLARFAGKNACVSLVATIDEAFNLSHFAKFKPIEEQTIPQLAISISAQFKDKLTSHVPEIGADNHRYLTAQPPA